MMLGYFDVFAGASGDMILGALVDAGLPLEVLERTVASLGLTDEVKLSASRSRKGFLMGTHVEVTCVERGHDGHHHRHLSDIRSLIKRSSLPAPVKEKSVRIFERLGEAEAKVHGIALEEVHFHEVGALDAVTDIVGSVAGLHALGVDRVVCSPLPLGRGSVRAAHGLIPLPAPATIALVAGHPVRGLELDAETVTPTGAAVLTTLAESFGPLPPMLPRRTGYGAGTQDLPMPNMLRLFVGESTPSASAELQALSLLSTNVDDMPGEWFGPLFEQLLGVGALDVWLTPIQMKKNRPAVQISVLGVPQLAPALRTLLLRETSTLGVREETVSRWSLPRESRVTKTPWGEVRVTVAPLPGGGEKAAPEFEDCRQRARESGATLREVYQAALNALGPANGRTL